MPAPVLQFKRGIVANLPGLRAGEPGFTTDSYDLYVGLTSETSTNKFFGSHRYWTKDTTSTGSGINVVEGTSNGSSYITLKSPDSLAGIVTYTLPGTDGSPNQFLATNGSGVLSFADPSGATLSIAGDTGTDIINLIGDTFTISGTSSEIVTAVTDNQVQIGLPDNVIIGAALTVTTALDVDGGADIFGHTELDNVNISGIITATSVVFGSGTAITSVDTDLTTVSASDDTLASAKAIKAYIDSEVTAQDLDFAGDTGTGAVDLDSQTFTIAGTLNEIETSASGQTITIGLPDNVVVGTSLSSPTVKVATLQHSNGTQAATIDTSGNIVASQNLTVTGNLYISGSTTQVNTDTLTVEDRTIELGIVNGSAPSATTTWDLGVLFNYYQTSAKKSAVVWEQGDARFKFASEVSDGGGTDNNSPQITFTSFAPIEIGSLWVTDCAGTSQVISCTGSERFLENITIDAGTF